MTPDSMLETASSASSPPRLRPIKFSIIKDPDVFSSAVTGGTNFDLEGNSTGLNPGRTMVVATSMATTEGENDSGEDAEWIGTLSVLSPANISQAPRDKPLPPHIIDAVATGDMELYMIIGVWVHPGYRKQKIGRRIVEHALEMIRSNSWQPPSTTLLENQNEVTAGPRPRKIVLLNVRENNDAARGLYTNIGFVAEEDIDKSKSKDGPGGDYDWMSFSFDK